MGLMQRAYETYCAMEGEYAGKYHKDKKEPLAPVGHLIKRIKYEITLDADGEFCQASAVGKDEELTVIPSTEASAGRSGTTAYMMTFPLCEAVKHITAENNYYIPQLEKWVLSEYCHPTAQAVLKYVKKGTVLADLARYGLIESPDGDTASKNDDFVRWRVLHDEPSATPECWKDPSLFRAFTQYYESERGEEQILCMVTGDKMSPAKQHAKGIVPLNGNAKLISANDSSGFTYRGRFREDSEAVTVSYEASQKAHNALRWLIVNQGEIYGGRTFLCWNPQGKVVRSPQSSFLRAAGKTYRIASDYRDALNSELLGLKAELPDNADIVLATFDAATTGRLALTYYSELPAADFLQRLRDWDAVCCWNNGPYGIQSPSLLQIVNCAFGTLRTSNGKKRFETDDPLLRHHLQRLISCRVNGAKMPVDYPYALSVKASDLQLIDDSGLREKLLFTACAVIRKYHYDRNGEEYTMSLEPEKKDISYQFGRLLAVLEKAERDTYDKEERREPNAMRLQSVYVQRPMHTFRILCEQVKNAYFPRLNPASRASYDTLMGEIIEKIDGYSENEQNRALADSYLLGYYLQKNALYQSKTDTSGMKETEE